MYAVDRYGRMPSYGLLLPTRASVLESDDSSELTARTRADVLGLARRAEARGFDSVWVGDSVTAKPRHEPLTTLAAVAAATEAVELGTAVYLPPLRDPVHIAHATATLDLLSGGRFVFGVGTGSTGLPGSPVEREYRTLGASWADRGGVLDETLAVVERLWSGEAIAYEGEHFTYDGVSIGLSPTRTPPVLVGGSVHEDRGVLRAIRRRVVDHGAGWFPVAASPDAVAHGADQIRADLEAAGRDPETLEVAFYLDVFVEDSGEAALEAYRRFVEAYYAGKSLTDAELRQRGAVGTPEAVRDRLDAYVAAGVDRFVVRFPTANQYAQLDRFAGLLG